MNIRSFDLNLLLAFESLMIERNVTRAARRSGLSQPAMSNALARLRRTLDDPLLVRTPEGMKPTPVAQSLMAPVRAALDGLRAALEERPVFDAAASRRTFHVLANDYAEIALLAPMIKELHASADGVTLRIDRPRSLFQPPAPSSLADTYDLAIGFFPDALSLEASLRSELLWEESNVCIARSGHPSIRGKLSLRQYAAAHHVAVFYKSEGPGVIDSLLQQKGYSRRSVVFVPHFASVAYMVSASDLIATVPERLAREFSKVLKLQVLPAPVAIPPFRLMMLWHERSHTDPAHAWLRNLVAETAMRLRAYL
ncbi:MAG TPA: LysR family transcriptional regulator [Blastocatellia bacterium]|nr:LysR family transcriptional regulator [Blastocatellia bacterium]